MYGGTIMLGGVTVGVKQLFDKIAALRALKSESSGKESEPREA